MGLFGSERAGVEILMNHLKGVRETEEEVNQRNALWYLSLQGREVHNILRTLKEEQSMLKTEDRLSRHLDRPAPRKSA
jgi:hypothetical protein